MKISYPISFSRNLFVIPVGKEFSLPDDEVLLLYSPFARRCTLIGRDVAEQLEAMLRGAEPSPEIRSLYDAMYRDAESQLAKSRIFHPDDYIRMSILPTFKCNFACSYCYSRHGRKNQTITIDLLRRGIDYFLRPGRSSSKFVLFISGGGEPLMAWEQLKYAVEYSRAKAAENQYDLEIMEICNGSCITEEIIDFLKSSRVNICISFEILEQLQNVHRGHYSQVKRNILLMMERGLIPSFNATITPRSVNLMSDMILEAAKTFPAVRNIMFEPMTAHDGFSSLSEMTIFYSDFLREFPRAEATAEQVGISLNTSILDDFNRTAERHCQGKLCLTPNGDFTICNCASSPEEKRFRKCCYGKIGESSGVEFDQSKFSGLMKVNLYSNPRCGECFAKWHCAGGCMSKTDAYSSEEMDVYCNYYRSHIKLLLLGDLDRQIRKSAGCGLEEFIRRHFCGEAAKK